MIKRLLQNIMWYYQYQYKNIYKKYIIITMTSIGIILKTKKITVCITDAPYCVL